MNKTNYIKYLLCCRTIVASMLFLCLSISPVLAQQDIVMRGAVVLQNSKTLTGQVTYIPDVNISSLKTTPTRSDSRGQFKLVFANMNFGAKTNISVWKSGMDVLNKEVLQEAVIVGRTDTLKVVMCDINQFEDNKQRFYNISTDNLQRELARRVNKLQRANAVEKRQLMDSLQTEMNIKLTSAEEAIAQLQNRSRILEAQLEKISRDFAAVNLDDASETYRLAYTAFTEGYVQKSLDILNAIDLKKRLQENVAQISQRDNQIAIKQRQNDTSRTQIAQDIQSCLLMANNHRILFQHREAQDWYETAIRFSDTTNLGLLNDYTSYLYEFGEFAKATRFNDISLRRARFLRQTPDSLLYTEGYAFGLYYRALLLSRKATEPDSTILTCFEAMPLFEQMVQTDSVKLLEMGRLISELAQAYSLLETDEGDSASIVWYKHAILVLQKPMPQWLQKDLLFYQSIAYLGLGITYRYVKKLDSSEIQCKQAVALRKQLFQIDSFRYAPYLSLSLTMLATTYNEKKKHNIALETLTQSIHYSSVSLPINPQLSKREILRTQLELARTFSLKQVLDTSEIVLDSIELNIQNYDTLYSDDWIDKLVDDFIKRKRTLIAEYLKQNDSEKAYLKSLKLYQFKSKDNFVITTHAIVLIFNNKYNQAVALLESIDNGQKIIKTALSYFEKKDIHHPDFARLRSHFRL